MVMEFFSKVIILTAGVLYPAYRSFKAVKTRNPREYVKWMMYWISFAFYTVIEAIADLLIGWWLPLYSEAKLLFFLWMLLPATNGTSILYRKFIHRHLIAHEEEIDEFLKQYKDKIYNSVLEISRNGVTMAVRTVVQSVINNGQNIAISQLAAAPSTANTDNGVITNDATTSDQDRQEIQREIVSQDNTDSVIRETYQSSGNNDGKRSSAEVEPSSQLDGEQRALLYDAFRNVDNRGFDDSDASLEIPSQDVSSGQSQLDLSFNLQSDNSSGVEDMNAGQQYNIVTRSQTRRRPVSTPDSERLLRRQDINTISEYMPQFDDDFASKLPEYWKEY